ISNGGFTPRSQPNMRPNILAGSPRGGSILMTSAPQSARIPPAAGPATQTPNSTTLMPSTGPGMPYFYRPPRHYHQLIRLNRRRRDTTPTICKAIGMTRAAQALRDEGHVD